MDYLGRLCVVSIEGDTLTIGLIIKRADIFSPELLSMLPNGNLIQAISSLWDVSSGDVFRFVGDLYGINWFDVVSTFPPVLTTGKTLPNLSYFLTGQEDVTSLTDDYRLQFITGDVLYQMGENVVVTISTPTGCMVATAVYTASAEPVVVPVDPDGYNRTRDNHGGAYYLPKSVTLVGGFFDCAYQSNQFDPGYSWGDLDYIDCWYNADLPLPYWHLLSNSGYRRVDAYVWQSPGRIRYVLVSDALPRLASFNSSYPVHYWPFQKLWLPSNHSAMRAYYTGYKNNAEKPPFYIPPNGGIPQGEFSQTKFCGIIPAITAIGLLCLSSASSSVSNSAARRRRRES